jgi:HD superfamily phosphohydrolase
VCVHFNRVCWAPDKHGVPHRQICYPVKMACEVSELFAYRMKLHQKIYQHKGTKIVELMLVDALALAEPHFRLLGTVDEQHPDGLWRLSEAVYDPIAFTALVSVL